jgi:hypothetical protein
MKCKKKKEIFLEFPVKIKAKNAMLAFTWSRRVAVVASVHT